MAYMMVAGKQYTCYTPPLPPLQGGSIAHIMKYGHPGGLDEVGVGGGGRGEGHPRCVPLSELPPFMPPRLSPLQVIIAIVMRDVLLSSCPPFNPFPLPCR